MHSPPTAGVETSGIHNSALAKPLITVPLALPS